MVKGRRRKVLVPDKRMSPRIPSTNPLLDENEHQIHTKPQTPTSSKSSSSSNCSHLCLSLPASAMAGLFRTRNLRRAALLSGSLNIAIIAIGTALFPVSIRRCGAREKSAVAAALVCAAIRLGSMLRAGIAQGRAALSIATAAAGGSMMEDSGDVSRLRRRRRYTRWLWWTRFGMLINALQFVVALYLMYVIVKDFSRKDGDLAPCFLD